MQYSTLFSAVLAFATATSVSASAIEARTNRKANEFTSNNCAQGTASYEHVSNFNVDVTMDDTSHSVYLANGDAPWYYFSDKVGNGQGCKGDLLGVWDNDTKNPCVDLDNKIPQRRIKCVRFGSPTLG